MPPTDVSFLDEPAPNMPLGILGAGKVGDDGPICLKADRQDW